MEDILIYDDTNTAVKRVKDKSVESIVIPEGVTSIFGGAFYGCRSLTKIIIPNSVTEIGVWAFIECRSLLCIDIPNSVKRIGEYAFGY